MENSRKTIIMVDDNITNLKIARNTLIGKYDIFTVPSGEKLFQILEKVTPDLILLDVDMPEMDGYEVIKILKRNKKTADIPVIFLTAMDNVEDEIKGLSLGAIDYITKPFSPPLLLKHIEVHLLVESQKRELQKYNFDLEKIIKEKTKMVFELQNAVLKTLVELVEFRDDITGRHIERTQNHLRVLLDALIHSNVYHDEISSWDAYFFIMSAQLHDVGKIAIRDSILLKSGALTVDEFEEMKKHTVIGARMIRKIREETTDSDFLMHAEILAISHHEKWDGTGYPYGVKGEAIPLQGRLMTIVDVYDALTNDRPYKKALAHEEAIEIIRDGIGTYFDPKVAAVFLENEQKFKLVKQEECNFFEMEIEPEGEAAASQELQRTLSNALAEIADYRCGVKEPNERADKMGDYIKVMVDALRQSPAYREAVSDWNTDLLILSTQLRDVGKLALDDSILHKPAKLTDAEFEKIKKHTDFGVKFIKKIEGDIGATGLLEYAEELIGSHHEKWNGTGYPFGLKGEEIPLQARLVAIIDVYNALTSERPYKKISTHREALEIIKNDSGVCFDPELVAVFLAHEKELADIYSGVRKEN